MKFEYCQECQHLKAEIKSLTHEVDNLIKELRRVDNLYDTLVSKHALQGEELDRYKKALRGKVVYK